MLDPPWQLPRPLAAAPAGSARAVPGGGRGFGRGAGTRLGAKGVPQEGKPCGHSHHSPTGKKWFSGLCFFPLPHHMFWVCRWGCWSRRKPHVHPHGDVHVLQRYDSLPCPLCLQLLEAGSCPAGGGNLQWWLGASPRNKVPAALGWVLKASLSSGSF